MIFILPRGEITRHKRIQRGVLNSSKRFNNHDRQRKFQLLLRNFITFAKEVSNRRNEDNRMRVTRWNQKCSQLGLFMKGCRYSACLHGYQIPANAVDHRLENGQVFESRHHEFEYQTTATARPTTAVVRVHFNSRFVPSFSCLFSRVVSWHS